jgi:hypothetical protein
MNQTELQEMARIGLDVEIARLIKRRDSLGKQSAPKLNGNGKVRKRRKFTAAERKLISKRMKAMWAAKRKG